MPFTIPAGVESFIDLCCIFVLLLYIQDLFAQRVPLPAPSFRSSNIDTTGTLATRLHNCDTYPIRLLRSGHRLIFGKHDIMEVVSEAIESFEYGFASKEQQAALIAWVSWYESWKGPSAGIAPVEEVSKIFSDLFFLGKLHNIEVMWVPKLREDHRAYGDAKLMRPGHVRIRLCPDRNSHNEIISTLLHECCHAFLQLYGCRQHRCHMEKHKCGYSGQTGHGGPWLHLASAVQKAAVAHLDLDANLNVLRSAAKEANAGNAMHAKDWCLFSLAHTAEEKKRFFAQMDRSHASDLKRHCRQDSGVWTMTRALMT